MFSIQAGATRLTFQQMTEETLYHIAFAIPGYESIEEGSRGAAWWIKEGLEFSGFL